MGTKDWLVLGDLLGGDIWSRANECANNIHLLHKQYQFEKMKSNLTKYTIFTILITLFFGCGSFEKAVTATESYEHNFGHQLTQDELAAAVTFYNAL